MKNISRGRWLFDTQLLVYALSSMSPFYERTKQLFLIIKDGSIQAVCAQQNIIEAERVLIEVYKEPVGEVVGVVEKMIGGFGFEIITPLPTTYLNFNNLMRSSARRFDFFDFYLAATMIDNKIFNILTVNDKDFEEIKNIKAVNPFKIVQRKDFL